MALLLGLTSDSAARSYLRSALHMEQASGAEHQIIHAEGWEEVFALAYQHPAHLLVFDPYAPDGLALATPIRFRQSFPSVALLPYGHFPGSHVRDVLRLAELGVRTVAVRGEDDHPATLRSLIHEALSSSAAQLVMAELHDLIPAGLLAVFRHVLSEAHRPPSNAEVSRLYCRHGKTLREHLRHAGLPPTQKLIAWGRLFHAAYLLKDRGRTILNVADTLGYPSESAFRHQFARYTGISLGKIEDRDGLHLLIARFRERQAQRNWDTVPVRAGSRTRPADPG